MKELFASNASLLTLDDTLKAHEPYAVITVGTTGLDKGDEDLHEATRVVVKEYEYSEDVKGYEEALSFDKMVKCSPEALQAAIVAQDSYDVFANAGIDRETYERGEGVLDRKQFTTELNAFLDALRDENVLMIANGADFVKHYLDKLPTEGQESPSKLLDEKAAQFKLLDQPKITREWLAEKGVKAPKATLETLRNAMAGREIDEKITGCDTRAFVISNCIQRYGEEKGHLVSGYESHFRRADKATFEEASARGKKEYGNASLEGKIKTLEETGVLGEATLDRSSNCNLNKLLDLMEGKTDAKGFTVMQAATTGFSAMNRPMQVTAINYTFTESGLTPTCLQMNIQVPQKALIKAIQDAENAAKGIPKAFDTFADAGITPEDVKAGKTPEAAVATLQRFFTKFPPEEYPIISNGGTKKNPEISYSQDALSQIGNIAAFKAPAIDFTQVIKEYTYRVMNDPTYDENKLFDEETYAGTFSLKDVAKSQNVDVTGSRGKCMFVAELYSRISQQNKELFPDHYPVELSAEDKAIQNGKVAKVMLALAGKESTDRSYQIVAEKLDMKATDVQRIYLGVLENVSKEFVNGSSGKQEAFFEALASRMTEETKTVFYAGEMSTLIEEAKNQNINRKAIVDIEKQEEQRLAQAAQSATNENATLTAEQAEREASIIPDDILKELLEGETTGITAQEQPKPSEKDTKVSPITEKRGFDRHRAVREGHERRSYRNSPSENTAQPAPARVDNDAIGELVALVKAQSETIQASVQGQLAAMQRQLDAVMQINAALLKQNEQYMQMVMQQQQIIMGMNAINERPSPTRANTPMERLDDVMGTLQEVSKEVSPYVAKNLSEASGSIARGQRELDKEFEKSQNAPAKVS